MEAQRVGNLGCAQTSAWRAARHHARVPEKKASRQRSRNPLQATSNTKHTERDGGERVLGDTRGLGPSVLALVLVLTHCLMAAEWLHYLQLFTHVPGKKKEEQQSGSCPAFLSLSPTEHPPGSPPQQTPTEF